MIYSRRHYNRGLSSQDLPNRNVTNERRDFLLSISSIPRRLCSVYLPQSHPKRSSPDGSVPTPPAVNQLLFWPTDGGPDRRLLQHGHVQRERTEHQRPGADSVRPEHGTARLVSVGVTQPPAPAPAPAAVWYQSETAALSHGPGRLGCS